MKRQPALHLREDDLVDILHSLNYVKMSPKNLASELMRRAMPLNVKSRYPTDLNTKEKKVVKRVVENETPIVGKFNAILTNVRLAHNHRGIKTIKKGDVEYTMLMEVAKMAYDFAEVYDYVPREDGYKVFCELGIEMMGKKYGLNKFKYYCEKIYEKAGFAIELNEYEDKAVLRELANYYNHCLEEFGSHPDYSICNDFAKLIYILWAIKMADEYDADYEEWVYAQFDEFSSLGFVPELSQLSTQKSAERYLKYKGKDISSVKDIVEKNPTLEKDSISVFESALQKSLEQKKNEINSRKH